MMHQYIKELLELKNSVVLPGIGGLLKVGKNIDFNEYLKFNDRKLTAFISEKENIDKKEADIKVKQLCEDITNTLEKESKYTFKGIGTLIKENDKLKFIQDSHDSKEQLKPSPNVKVTPEPEKKPIVNPLLEKKSKKVSTDYTEEEALERIKSIDSKEELIAFAENDDRSSVSSYFIECLTNFKKEEEKQKTKEIVTPLPETEQKELNKIKDPKLEKPKKEEKEKVEKEKTTKPLPLGNENSEKENINDVIEDKVIEKIAIGAEKIEKEVKRRKLAKILLWLGMILIVIGVSLYGYLEKERISNWFNTAPIAQHEETTLTKDNQNKPLENSDTKKNVIEKSNSSIDSNDDSEAINTSNDTKISESAEEIDEEVSDPIEIISSESIADNSEENDDLTLETTNNKHYHIIVGSFSKKENALNLVEQLKSEGYKNASILGKFNSLQSVKLDSYQTIEEAKSALEASGKNGWVKKY